MHALVDELSQECDLSHPEVPDGCTQELVFLIGRLPVRSRLLVQVMYVLIAFVRCIL